MLMTGALLALVGGYYWGNQYKHSYRQDHRPPLQNLSATLLRQAKPLADFELTSHGGETITSVNLGGRWSLLFFGCSRCAGTPGALTRLLRVRNRLADRPLLQNTTLLIMVTVEPERDDALELDALVRGFGPGFVGLTGPASQIGGLARQLGMPDPGQDSADPAIFLLAPGGLPVAIFPAASRASEIAADFKQIVDHDAY